MKVRDEKIGKQKKELCIIQHFNDIKHPKREYKKRWKNLIKLVLMCVSCMLYEGRKVKVMIKSKGFRWLSIFRSGLDAVLRRLINREKPPLVVCQKTSKSA